MYVHGSDDLISIDINVVMIILAVRCASEPLITLPVSHASAGAYPTHALNPNLEGTSTLLRLNIKNAVETHILLLKSLGSVQHYSCLLAIDCPRVCFVGAAEY